MFFNLIKIFLLYPFSSATIKALPNEHEWAAGIENCERRPRQAWFTNIIMVDHRDRTVYREADRPADLEHQLVPPDGPYTGCRAILSGLTVNEPERKSSKSSPSEARASPLTTHRHDPSKNQRPYSVPSQSSRSSTTLCLQKITLNFCIFVMKHLPLN